MCRLSMCFVVVAALAFGAGMAAVSMLAAGGTGSGDQGHFRIAVSVRTLGPDVNENDARNAMKLWADAVARQSGMAIEYPAAVVSSSEELIRLVRARELDGFALLTEEYLEVAALADHQTILLDDRYAGGGEEYLLLVHQESGLTKLEDLRGKSLAVENGTRDELALPWLEVTLSAAKLRPVKEYFGRVLMNSRPSRVVLPVFFRQADACLVTRWGFEVMSELNPQLGRRLRPLLTSPRLVPNFLAFHRDCPPARKQRLVDSMTRLQETAFGRQALTFFQCHALIARDPSIVQRSVDLLGSYRVGAARGVRRLPR